MRNAFARCSVSLFALFYLSYSFPLSCHEPCSSWAEEAGLADDSLVLPDDEPEHLVSMMGKLQLRAIKSDPESDAGELIHYWILKLSPASFEMVCSTPVRASFQTPASIRSSRNSDEMELVGDYDEGWLYEHLDQTVTVEGYLRHAHTGHHHAPVMIDSEPWFK